MIVTRSGATRTRVRVTAPHVEIDARLRAGTRTRVRAVAHAATALAGAAIILGASASPALAAPGIDHHTISASLDPAFAHLEARDVMTLDDDFDGSDRPLRFLLHRNLTISEVRLDDAVLTASEEDEFNPKHFWRRPDYAALAHYAHAREVEIPAPEGGWPDDARVEIAYAGAVNDTLRPPEEDYGRGFMTTTGLIEERGAYLGGGTFWIPTVPDDLFTFDLQALVPMPWDVVSQGALAKRTHLGGATPEDARRSVRWECDAPMTEAYLVAGPWHMRRVKHGDTQVYTYTYAQDEALTDTYLDATGDYLDRYEALIGPYPFPKFALVENFWETGYGMPSFTLLGSTVIRLPFIVHTSYGHEILHCWWGNGVFVDVDRGNWCEGLTSYMADYAYKEAESAEAARDYRRNQLTGYKNYVSERRDLALRDFRERHSGATQAIGYGKAMMLFHMIRDAVGHDAFHDALRAFYAEHEFTEASWDDLLDAFAAHGDVDAGSFLATWIDQPGAPLLRMGEVHAGATRDGHAVTVRIEQEEPVLPVDVPVVVTTADGEETRTRVRSDAPSVDARVELDAEPVTVALDPDFDVFRRLHREEIPPVISQTMGADSSLIVLPSSAPAELLAAYEELADGWSRRPGVGVVRDDAITLDALADASVWLLGDTRFDGRFGESGPAGAVFGPEEAWSVVETRIHPLDPALSWSRLDVADPALVPVIGRKVPHYGKYSYLAFDGPQNVAKGTWRIADSPMITTISLPEGS